MSATDPDYAWLIEARASIQQDLLSLLTIVSDKRSALEASDERQIRSVFLLLVGAAFSLWRAAFLSNIDRSWKDIFDKTAYLLKEVLTTNAVPFSIEHKARDWVFGYYLNNAIFRLEAARKHLGGVPSSDALARFDQLSEHGIIKIDKHPTELWTIAHAALRELSAIVTKRLESGPL